MSELTPAPAWIVAGDNPAGETGVLVRMGDPARPYWWLLCPADATLYISGDRDDMLSCHDSSCGWEDIHRAATELVGEVGPDPASGNG